METNNESKLEDRRVEYVALRAEILQSDNNCLIMMGYLITAVGFLYSVSLEWLVSLLSFISLTYFTEKRFAIRRIASFMASDICTDESGFMWECYVQKMRQKQSLRPFNILRPYNAELITCSVVAFSPIMRGTTSNLIQLNPSAVFWLLFFVLTIVLSVTNFIIYKRI
jgi:hypothetical protein